MGVAAAALLTAVGCGDDGSAADDADGTTAPPTTLADSTTTTLSVEAEIEARYREWARIMRDAGRAPNPDDPRLAEIMVEPRLSIARDALAGLRSRNHYYVLGDATGEEVLSIAVQGDTATLVACVTANDKLIDRDTGVTIPGIASTAKDEATLRLVNGAWMVANYSSLATWEGLGTCDR